MCFFVNILPGLDVESVEQVMEELKEVLADQTEIDDVLKAGMIYCNNPPHNAGHDAIKGDEMELEEELEALLKQEEQEKKEPEEIQKQKEVVKEVLHAPSSQEQLETLSRLTIPSTPLETRETKEEISKAMLA